MEKLPLCCFVSFAVTPSVTVPFKRNKYVNKQVSLAYKLKVYKLLIKNLLNTWINISPKSHWYLTVVWRAANTTSNQGNTNLNHTEVLSQLGVSIAKNTKNNKCWQRCAEIENPTHRWSEHKMMSLLEKRVFSKTSKLYCQILQAPYIPMFSKCWTRALRSSFKCCIHCGTAHSSHS